MLQKVVGSRVFSVAEDGHFFILFDQQTFFTDGTVYVLRQLHNFCLNSFGEVRIFLSTRYVAQQGSETCADLSLTMPTAAGGLLRAAGIPAGHALGPSTRTPDDGKRLRELYTRLDVSLV